MKKIFTTLMCVATVAMFIGCGGQNKKVDSTQKEEVVVEKVFETGASGEGTKTAALEAFKYIGLTLEQIEPDYKYLDDDTLNIFKGMVFKGLYEGLVVFVKADKADVSREEFENYVRKIYDVTKKTAEDGKVIYGFEKRSKADEANAEWSVDDILAQKIMGFPLKAYDWGFKFKGKYMRMAVSLIEANKKYPARLRIRFYDALQKSMNETMDDAEKALEDPEVQKVIKEALK